MPPKENAQGFQSTLMDVYYGSISLISVNVIWFLLTLPVVTAFPALGGLYYATNRFVHDKSADWRTFFEGFRLHFWLSWRWGLVNLLVLGVIGGSVWFYARVETNWGVWVSSAALGLLILWGILQIYTFPLLMEQEDRCLLVAVRNSAVILLRRPAFTLGLAAGLVILVLLSTFLISPAWAFITASSCTYLANRAVIDSIEKITGETGET